MKIKILLILVITTLAASACSPSGGAPATPSSIQPSPTITVQCVSTGIEYQDPLLPGDHVAGEADNYSVTLIIYSDFQCESCVIAYHTMEQLLSDFPNDLRYIFRHAPYTPQAKYAARAAEAAGLQGGFWTFYDLLYQNQADWADLSPEDLEAWFYTQAEAIGFDADLFISDYNDPDVITFIDESAEFAAAIGIPSTPFIFLDGAPLDIEYYKYDPLKLLLERTSIPLGRLTKKQYAHCPGTVIDLGKEYIATLHTQKGDIVIALYPEIAPFAVNNFVFLAQEDYYDNVTFHLVVEGLMAQGGDPSGTGWGGPGYFFSIEVSPTLTFNRAGLVAMYNTGPTSNGSQFFITLAPMPEWNGRFTIFGEVISGMDVVLKLTPRNLLDDPFAPPGDIILDVTIEEK